MKKFLLPLLILCSCSKNKSTQEIVGGNNNQTNIESELVGKKWQIFKLIIQTPGSATNTNEIYTLPAHQQDDYYVFDNDHTYKFYDNTSRVPGSATDILDKGSWSLTANQITFTSNLFPATIAGISISARSLHLDFTDQETNVKKFYVYEIIP